MPQPHGKNYDVIIIGAGISGLVCGCYLAKGGMKVLLAEQHFKPGGYCTAFKRGGFTFDAAAHCFGGYRKNGVTKKIFKDLGIERRLKIKKNDPSDTVITPDYRISYWADIDKTIEEFNNFFPQEANNVKKFFSFLLNPDPSSFSRMRHGTFKDLLDQYFANETLKTLLSAPLLGLGGLPPALMSAFIGAKLFSEFLLDGGYHPVGGMQALPNALAERFKELGGELLLSCPIKKIKVEDNEVRGVIFKNGGFASAPFVVSNCDARQTFLKLLGSKMIEKEFYLKLKSMTPSISNFIVYLGLDGYFKSLSKPGTTICSFQHYDLNRAYRSIREANMERYGGYMYYVSQDIPTVLAIIPAPYKNRSYWKNNKRQFLNSFIDRLEQYSIPGLKKHIIYKDAATPQTLHRYTANYRGASFGWAGTPSQLALSDFKKPSFVKGLYLTGHWTTHGLGISGVVYVGHDIAQMILRKRRNVINPD